MSPQRMVGWHMHAFSNMIQSNYYQRTEKPLGVALPEWRVLRATVLAPGSSQGEIAASEGLNVMIVSRAVAGLRRKGLLDVSPDPNDRRRTQLEPTEMGQAFAGDMADREQIMYSHACSVLSPDELGTLDELLARILDHVRENRPPEVPPPSRPWRDIIEAHVEERNGDSNESDSSGCGSNDGATG